MVRLICKYLRSCILYVIMASRTYGVDTGSPCATDFELECIMDMEKRNRRPVCIARMIGFEDGFVDDVCAMYVSRSKAQHIWIPGPDPLQPTPVPQAFVDSIVNRHTVAVEAMMAMQLRSGPGQTP